MAINRTGINMRKVTLLSGSPRLQGNTMLALKECAKAIEAEGVETEILSLAGKKIQSCQHCGSCAMSGKCAIDDGLNEIAEKVRGSDGFIVGSPVYFGTPRGDLMSALQRISCISMLAGGFLSRKVGGPIAICNNEGLTSTNQSLLTFFLAGDMIVPGTRLFNGAHGNEPGEVLKDEAGMASIRRFGENVAYLINVMKL